MLTCHSVVTVNMVLCEHWGCNVDSDHVTGCRMTLRILTLQCHYSVLLTQRHHTTHIQSPLWPSLLPSGDSLGCDVILECYLTPKFLHMSQDACHVSSHTSGGVWA